MRKTQATKLTQRESKRGNPDRKSSSQPAQQIREGDALTSAGIEQGHSQSEIPKNRRKNFASFGSE